MSGTDAAPVPSRSPGRWAAFLILLGLYLTVRGYRSFEGDQAYRLPILIHQQDACRYDGDPFVRSFDRFNPHRGYFLLLGAAARPAGLAAALAALYVLTYGLTCRGLGRLARAVWGGGSAGAIGPVTVALVLIAQAGNIGTNHLFEPILLDRLIAFGLAWVGLGALVENPARGGATAAAAVGLAGLVHPSVGLQLALLLGSAWAAWAVLGVTNGVGRSRFVAVGLALAAAVLPGALLNLRDSRLLLEGLPAEQVRLLSAELQSPQHMLPHLWRLPQWLAWGCFPLLASLAVLTARPSDPEAASARKRLVVTVGVLLAGLAAAWFGIERLENLRLTLFQPFRMATIARGLCLVALAGHVLRLWRRGELLDRPRSALVVVGLAGDWSLVVVTLVETVACTFETFRDRWGGRFQVLTRIWPLPGLALLAAGVWFLSRYDTESGHVPILAAAVGSVALGRLAQGRRFSWSGRRLGFRVAAAWAVPVAALAANVLPEDAVGPRGRSVREALVRRCRFAEVPADDVERLALWCRANTPADARFIGPPGPKTLRLWSRRSLAFNRAGSPYAAAGLADWARRFADHVGLDGPPAALVAAYLHDRHGLERRYGDLGAACLADLAARQGAGYVVATLPRERVDGYLGSGLVPLHSAGKYTVFRVDLTDRTARRPGADRTPRR